LISDLVKISWELHFFHISSRDIPIQEGFRLTALLTSSKSRLRMSHIN
jgi:hypothetical protein